MLPLPSLGAEQVFQIGPLPITNTMVNSFAALILFAIFAFFLNRGIKKYYGQPHPDPLLRRRGEKADKAPKGVLNFFESILEFILAQIDNVTKDRKKTLKFLPIVGTLFLFILVSNWMGLIPGTGSIGIHKGTEFIPLFRPANTDLNMTLAMAVFAVVGSHIIGIFTIGFFKYANKFIKLGDIYFAIKSLNPVKILTAVIEFFVGLIEIFSEAAKMVSLSLRLFGNIFAGEVLLTVIASLIGGFGAYLIPLPFMGLELLVGAVQATVFAMLTLVYLTMATAEIHGHGEEEHREQNQQQAGAVARH